MATKRIQPKSDALDAARIKAMADGGTINPALIAAAANGQPSPYIQDPTVSSSFGGTWNMNPTQFATSDTANRLGTGLGATVGNAAPTSGPITYGQPQNMLDFGGGPVVNAGLEQDLINKGYDAAEINAANGSGGSSITDAQLAAMRSASAPPAPGATDGGNPGVSAQTNGYGSGRTSLQVASGNGRPAVQDSSTAGTQRMSGITSGDPNSNAAAAAAAAARRTTSYPTFPPSSSSPNVPGGPNLPSTSPNGAPNLSNMSPQQIKAMYGDNAYAYALQAWQNSGQRGPAPNQSDYYGTATPAGSGGGAGAGGGGAPSGGYSTAGGIPTSYVPPAPNGSYPSVPGGYTTPAISAPGTGGDSNLAQSLESDRELAIATGHQLQDQFGSENAAANARTAALQGKLQTVYDPLLRGEGGYTADQAAGIMDENGPHGLNTLDPNAMNEAFDTGASGVTGAIGNESSAIDQSLAKGRADVNSTINPAELTYTPEMEEAAMDKAARESAAKTQSAAQDIQNRAFAAGNDSPAAIAAMQDRARQTGAIDTAESQANAKVAQNAARLAAAQAKTNITSQNAQELAQRDVGARLNVGATDVGAKTALTSMGVGAAQAGQTEGMNLNTLESGRATTVANENQKQSAEARQNLQSQEQQSSQKADVTGQQELGTYGTQNTGVNQAAGGQIQNKAVNQSNPGNATHIIFGAKGIPPMDGPVVAEVGEKRDPHSPTGYAPEAIVNLGPPHEMAHGGAVRPPKLLAPPRFAINRPSYGIPAPQPRQISRVGFNRQLPQFADGGEVLSPDYAEANDALGDDSTKWWQKAAGYATQATLGRRFPEIAAMLARAERGEGGGSSKDYGAAAVSDALKRNPAAQAAARAAIGKSPAQQAQDAKWGQDYQQIMSYKPPEYHPAPIAIESGGGQPKLPSIPRPGSAKTPDKPRTTPAQTQPSTQPPSLGMPRGGDKPREDVTTKIEYSPSEHVDSTISFGQPVPTPPVTKPPVPATPIPGGSVDTRISYPQFPGAGGQLPPGTGPVASGGSSTTDPGLKEGADESIDFGQGPIDAGTGENVDPYTNLPGNLGNPGPDPTTPVGGGGPIDYPVDPTANGGDMNVRYVNGPPTAYGPGSNNTGSGFVPDPFSPGGSEGVPWKPDYNTGEPTYEGQPSFDPTRGGYDVGGGYGGNLGIGDIGGDFGGNYGGGSRAPDPHEGGFDGFAKGGIVSPSRVPNSPYGVEVVDRPQIRVLGQRAPQAVVPLKGGKNANVKPREVPGLIQKYSRQRPQYGA